MSADEPIFAHRALAKHRGLAKHESSIVTQVRIGKIGLRALLFIRRVPDVALHPRVPGVWAGRRLFRIIVTCPDTEEAEQRLYYRY